MNACSHQVACIHKASRFAPGSTDMQRCCCACPCRLSHYVPIGKFWVMRRQSWPGQGAEAGSKSSTAESNQPASGETLGAFWLSAAVAVACSHLYVTYMPSQFQCFNGVEFSLEGCWPSLNGPSLKQNRWLFANSLFLSILIHPWPFLSCQS